MLRRIASKVHLYVGLTLGGVLILVSLSGSLLVFKGEIDRWLRPDLYPAPHASGETSAPLEGAAWEGAVPVDEALGAAQAALPDQTPWIVQLPVAPEAPYVVWMGREQHVYVHPATGQVLGQRGATEGMVNVLFALHERLLAGSTGAYIVGISGVLLVVLGVTGIVLWWPRRLRALRTALVIAWRRGGLRFNYDVHRAGGFWTLAFVLLTALTGSALIFYAPTQSLIATLTQSEPWPDAPPTVKAHDEGLPPRAYHEAIEVAVAALPSATPTFAYVPQTPEQPITVRLRTPPEWHPNGRSFVYVHPATGHVLRADDARTAPRGARLMHALYPLHIGAVGGGFVRVLYALFGVAPAVLSVTGTIIWYRRWRKQDRTIGVPPGTRSVRHAVLPRTESSEEPTGRRTNVEA